MDYRPSHLGLCVSDLERSMRFYCDGLGFEAADGHDLSSEVTPDLAGALEVDPPFDIRAQFIVKEPWRIELIHWRSPAAQGSPSTQRNQLGYTNLAFVVDDIEKAVARLVENGGTVASQTTSFDVQMVYLADPDGTRVELLQFPS